MGNKVWSENQINDLLCTNNRAVIRGLLAIDKGHKENNLALQEGKELNNIDFNHEDYDLFISFVDFYNNYGYLSPKQIKILRKELMKYIPQLTMIANKEK